MSKEHREDQWRTISGTMPKPPRRMPPKMQGANNTVPTSQSKDRGKQGNG